MGEGKKTVVPYSTSGTYCIPNAKDMKPSFLSFSLQYNTLFLIFCRFLVFFDVIVLTYNIRLRSLLFCSVYPSLPPIMIVQFYLLTFNSTEFFLYLSYRVSRKEILPSSSGVECFRNNPILWKVGNLKSSRYLYLKSFHGNISNRHSSTLLPCPALLNVSHFCLHSRFVGYRV